MTWSRFSDDFADRPEVLALSDAAFRLHFAGVLYCNRVLSDGAIPARAIRRLTDGDEVALTTELVASGLWQTDGDGYVLDWADQVSREQILEQQRANAERQQRYRERRLLHAAGDHSRCDKRFCNAVTNPVSNDATPGVSNAVTDGVSNNTPSHPIPSRPLQGQGGGAGRSRSRGDDRPRPHNCAVDGHVLAVDRTSCTRCEWRDRDLIEQRNQVHELSPLGRTA